MFLAPLALLGAALLALPVIVHTLTRRHARSLDFPSLEFLRDTPLFRLRPRRLRQPLLLTLRLLALIFLIAGFARPEFSVFKSKTRKRVILLDASASMRVPGRRDAALEQARSLIRNSASDEIAIVSFSTDARVLSKFERNASRLEQTLAEYSLTFERGDYRRALESSDELLRGESADQCAIEIISDFQLSNLESLQLEPPQGLKCTISAHAVGAPIEKNSFIQDISLEDQKGRWGIESVEVELGPDGARSVSHALDLDDALANPAAALKRDDAGRISGAITSTVPDDFDADDSRFFVATPSPSGAAIIGADSESLVYWSTALSVAGAPSDTVAVKSTGVANNELDKTQLVVLSPSRDVGEQELRDAITYAQRGGLLLVVAGRDFAFDRLKEALGTVASELPIRDLARVNRERRFGPFDLTAAALKRLGYAAAESLRNTRVYHSFDLVPTSGADVLARWSDGRPALVAKAVGAGRVLFLGTSVDRQSSDLGLAPGFPSLIASIYQARNGSDAIESAELGEMFALGVSPDTQIRISSTEGNESVATARDLVRQPGRFINRPGIYTLAYNGQSRVMAFNTPRAESSTDLASADLVANILNRTGQGAASKPVAVKSGGEWQSRVLLLVGMLFLALELLLWIRLNGRRKDATAAY